MPEACDKAVFWCNAVMRRTFMNKPGICLVFLSLLALHGCFDNSGNETKNNTDNSKSSVQMHEGDTKENK
jgi:hypothetical protein